jgi:hypothetical protein
MGCIELLQLPLLMPTIALRRKRTGVRHIGECSVCPVFLLSVFFLYLSSPLSLSSALSISLERAMVPRLLNSPLHILQWYGPVASICLEYWGDAPFLRTIGRAATAHGCRPCRRWVWEGVRGFYRQGNFWILLCCRWVLVPLKDRKLVYFEEFWQQFKHN